MKMIFLLDEISVWPVKGKKEETCIETIAASTNLFLIAVRLKRRREEFPNRDYCVRVFDSSTGTDYTTLSQEKNESDIDFFVRLGEFLAKTRPAS